MYLSQLGIQAAAVTGCICSSVLCLLVYNLYTHVLNEFFLSFVSFNVNLAQQVEHFYKSTKFIWHIRCKDEALSIKKAWKVLLSKWTNQINQPVSNSSRLQMVQGATLAARHPPVVSSDEPRCLTKLLSRPLETKVIKRCPLWKAFRAALCLLLT